MNPKNQNYFGFHQVYQKKEIGDYKYESKEHFKTRFGGDKSSKYFNKNLNSDMKRVKDSLNYEEKDVSKTKPTIPYKRFEKRRSLLVELVEDNIHFRAGYNAVIGTSLFIMLSLNLKEYLLNRRISPALNLIFDKLGKFHVIFVIWVTINLATFLCFYMFILWAKMRRKCTVHNQNLCDKGCLILLVSYYCLWIYLIPRLIYDLQIPFASDLIIGHETIRFLMKLYAFVRSNAPNVLVSKKDENNYRLPKFSHFVTFLNVPTFIYRDEYPRSSKIRWSFVFYRFIEIFWSVLCLAHLYIYTAIPIFKDVCIKPVTHVQLFIMFLEIAVPSLLMMFLLFLSSIHSIQDAAGEVSKFGDRMFYSDWWNSFDMQTFYKKWNWVVGDWLWMYINKDISEKVFPGQKVLGKFLTLAVSAAVHEWIFTMSAGFFCPIITGMLFFGAILGAILKVKRRQTFLQIINFTLLPIGPGVIATFMFVEHFARQNMPTKSDDMFVFWNNCFV